PFTPITSPEPEPLLVPPEVPSEPPPEPLDALPDDEPPEEAVLPSRLMLGCPESESSSSPPPSEQAGKANKLKPPMLKDQNQLRMIDMRTHLAFRCIETRDPRAPRGARLVRCAAHLWNPL